MKYLFVYGTLMKGQRAEEKMSDGIYVGDYVLADYAMYNLGRYPGIVPNEGDVVYGEVYQISPDMIPVLDEYEEEGSLYHRKEVRVCPSDWREEYSHESDEGMDTLNAGQEDLTAIVYVYAKEVVGDVMKRPWGR